MGKNQESQERKNRKILPYVGFTIRILFGAFAILIAMLYFLDLAENADTRFSYGLCFLLPVFAVFLVVGDLYLHYKLDIRPLRKKRKERRRKPLEFK